LGEGRGNTFITFLKRGRKEIAVEAVNSTSSGTSGETIPEGQAGGNCESHWKKMIGKPYSGKPNVRFDEGELEIELLATTPALYSTESYRKGCLDTVRQLKYWSGQLRYPMPLPMDNRMAMVTYTLRRLGDWLTVKCSFAPLQRFLRGFW